MDAETIADLALATSEIRRAADGSTPFVVIPKGANLLDLEKLLPHPARKRGSAILHDAASFVAYVNAHKTAGTRLFANANANAPAFLAILDHHSDGDGDPGWCGHWADYACPKSLEWIAWMGANKKEMGQEQFAQFLEDNLPDIIDPVGADVLTVAQSLEATTKVRFGSAIRLDNGQRQLIYEEAIEGSANRGTMKIPAAFTIAIPPFQGSPRFKLMARLRYRIPKDGGALTLWYDLHRPEKVIEVAFFDELALIRDGRSADAETGLPSMAGVCLPVLMGTWS